MEWLKALIDAIGWVGFVTLLFSVLCVSAWMWYEHVGRYRRRR